jgi:hypothetical protein
MIAKWAIFRHFAQTAAFDRLPPVEIFSAGLFQDEVRAWRSSEKI